MALFLPEQYCNVHFASAIDTGPEVTFAIAYHLIDPTPLDLSAVYDDFVEFGLAIGWTGLVAFTAVRAEVGTADPSEPLTYEFTGSEEGSGTNAIASPQVSFLAKKRTAQGGRKNRGRMFIPHVQEAVVDDRGVVSSGFVEDATAALQDFGAAVAGHLEADGFFILHTDPDDAPTEITSVAFESKVATQRRRFRR